MSLKAEKQWLVLLLLTDLFFAFLAWLTGADSFGSIIVIIFLFTAFIVLAGYRIDRMKQKKQMEMLQLFLNSPDEEAEQRLLATVDDSWHSIIRMASAQIREQSQTIKDKQLELQNYQEFIEAWTHEIKTPLSLATLILANHREEMSPYVYNRMEHVRSTINNDVERILYYARLQSSHVDYKFMKMNLSDCVQECLEDFRAISDEKKIDVQLNLSSFQIISDKKVLAFMLSQLFSNAFKYTASDNGVVCVVSWSDTQDDGKIHLAVRDNGKGVPPEDMPFLFDKGFTGSHPDRKNATGMGLYLVKKYAEALSVEVNIEPISTSDKGFGIELLFPHVI
ncbi:sensor histidine kinase [Dehalobacterium formicoaceticum]|uniref:histidine kinase n=1 Tax=Dehalobacterium formicoaceticum TaxID=51515 RepID=A0ABT1Y6I1_9FIRM|nr:HAMP domain-containing sensor histidine kinase [Dehalobacterium formicoaceticum]MCR6546477.1 HAMP domain-containing histidine kinase [Dehalobacterium formicoaceticum]